MTQADREKMHRLVAALTARAETPSEDRPAPGWAVALGVVLVAALVVVLAVVYVGQRS